MPPIVLTASLLLLAYLIGSVSGSLVLGRFRNIDIREHGSGNAGGTNALRTLGWKFALGVALIDIAKGALATWLALRYAPVGTALSVNLSLVTLAQGETVKRLGAWAALLAAPTLVTSWYGMNFAHMPELEPKIA